jgi:hypothetical protein
MGSAKEKLFEMQEERSNRHLADTLGISYEELMELTWSIEIDASDDGLVYTHRVEFIENGNQEILEKINGLEKGYRVYLSPWEFEDDIEREELEWEIRFSQQFKIFKEHSVNIEKLLFLPIQPESQFSLLVMLHAHAIATLEGYLSSTFIHTVTNSATLTRKLIESDSEIGKQKFSLNEIYKKHEELKIIVATYLKSLIFHDIKKIKLMYRSVLGFDFGDIHWLFDAVRVRHDCVHRTGYDKEGKIVSITCESINELNKQCRILVAAIEAHNKAINSDSIRCAPLFDSGYGWRYTPTEIAA